VKGRDVTRAGNPIVAAVSNEDARKNFPEGWKGPKP
jgi:hypothetical protein